MLPPRLILFGGIIVMGCIMQIIDWPLALKWWALFLIMGSHVVPRDTEQTG